MKTFTNPTDAEVVPSQDVGPAGQLEAAQTQSEILRAISALPSNQREVVRLKFQNDLSYKEIAEVTGLSVTNVGFLLHTAIEAMRRQMGAGSKKVKSGGAR